MSSIHSRLTKEEIFFIRRIEGLHEKAGKSSQTLFTPFVSPQVLEHVSYLKDSRDVVTRIFRINPFAEQVMMAFAPDGRQIPDEDFPVTVLEIIEPTPQQVSHRDVLGSLMGLGIKREMIGDLFLDEEHIFIVATRQMVDFLKDNLLLIGRHHVRIQETSVNQVRDMVLKGEDRLITVSSKRLDLLISKVFNLSRSKSQSLFSQGRIKHNHLVLEHYKREMAVGDLLSVRGSGRFRLLEELGTTRKGNLQLRIRVFK